MEFYGRHTGMRLNHYLAFLYKRNEIAQTKFTDEELLAKVKSEFRLYPELKPKLTAKLISESRSNYNTGHLKASLSIPRQPSFRYEKDGTILSVHGKPLGRNQVKAKLHKHRRRLILANSKAAQAKME